MRFISIIFLFLFATYVSAQIVNQQYDFNYYQLKSSYSIEKFTALKSSFSDSLETGGLALNHENTISMKPLINLNYNIQSEVDNVTGYGFGGIMNLKKNRWRSSFTFFHLNQDFVQYQRSFASANRVVPGMNTIRGSNRLTSQYINGFVNFKASKIFDLEIGYGKAFIGDGYRSLLRSDASNSSPYFKINTQFWKIKYTNIFAAHQNIFNVEGNQELFRKKYSATHYLDYKATKWLTIGLFETIIWQAKEGNYTRGFDPNYANPFIFYRPVEFSVGSSDNALVGANIKIQPTKNHFFYSQLIFDEFLLDELKADVRQSLNPDEDIQSGWWANKYGIQIGWNAFDLFEIEGLQTRVEFNLVRPFTYAHGSPTQAYSHYNMSLAHPLGANFHEFVSMVNYTNKKWLLKLRYNQSRQGVSEIGTNFGENLQLSNADRIQEYENKLTQGIATQVNYFETSIGYLMHKELNAVIELGYISRKEKTKFYEFNNNYSFVKLKMNLFNQYFDY